MQISLAASTVRAVLVPCLWGSALALLTVGLTAQAQAPFDGLAAGVDATQVSLPRLEPLSPEQAMHAFETLEGLSVELVAAEPLVVDPVAFQFDAAGRLWVIEMVDYSEQASEQLGRLSVLTDLDGDGRMDQATVVLEQLSWPTALAVSSSGVLVAAPPDLIWLPLGSDGVTPAGPAQLWYTGFGRNNVQGMLNSFRWGLDQRWHATTSSNGAEVRSADQLTEPEAPPLMRLRGQDFSLDLPSRQLTAVLGGGQHGMDFNPWGDKFATSNSDHLQQIVGWHHSPHFQADLFQRVQTRRSIAADGPQAEVYRSSPVEPWRTLRTHLRLTGITPGVIEGGGRAAGYFTGATGVVIYTGDQWSPSESSLALVSDVGGNLVHRKRLDAEGLWWSGHRIDEETEILTSRDIWFRPVQLGMGPDGCLYMADMYREVIEHPASLPPLIKDQLDLTSGRDRGRIWRLRDSRRPIRRGSPGLDQMSEAELVACLDHPNGWHRQTAARLLAERGGVRNVTNLRNRLAGSPLPEGRLQILAILAQTPGGLDADSWQVAAADRHPRVRAWTAAWAAESGLPNDEPDLAKQLLAGWAQDPSLHVRWELAMAAASWWPQADARAVSLLNLMQGSWDNSDLSVAVEIGLPGAEDALLEQLLTGKAKAGEQTELPPAAGLHKLVAIGLYQLLADPQVDIEQLLSRIDRWSLTSDSQAQLLLQALGDVLPRRLSRLSAEQRQQLADWVAKRVTPEDQIPADQVAAQAAGWPWPLLGLLEVEQRLPLLDKLLAEPLPPSIQLNAISHLIGSQAASQQRLLERLERLAPEAAVAAIQKLAGNSLGRELIADALEHEQLSPRQIPAPTWTVLQTDSDRLLVERLTRFAPVTQTTPWASIQQEYAAPWRFPGDAQQGLTVFKTHCAGCHRAGPHGQEIGPGLASIRDKPHEQIAIAIAEPNREVDPKYQTHQVLTESGQAVVGIIEQLDDSWIVLRDAQGQQHRIDREEVERFQPTGLSLMPEGLLKEISPEQLRDLITFLRNPD